MSDDLSVLKRHLGEFRGEDKVRAQRLGEQLFETNDFVASLQMLDLKLKTLAKSLQTRAFSDTQTQQSIDSQNETLIKNATFMDTPLFDAVFRTAIQSEIFVFSCPSPLSMLANGDFKGVLNFIDDKRGEISRLFDELDAAMECDFDPSLLNAGGMDFCKGLFGKL